MKKKVLLSVFSTLLIATAVLLYSYGGTDDYKVITVKKGENINSISAKYLKSKKYKSDLLRYNRMSAGQVKPGKKIKIPYSISRERAARVKFLKGSAKRKRGAGSWKVIRRVGTVLVQSDVIKTGKTGMMEIQFDDGSMMKIVKNSVISLKRYRYSKKGRNLNINVKSGAIFANVKRLSRSSKFSVSSGNAVVGVRGTEFYVGVSKNKSVKVEVYKGKVVVKAKNKKVTVPAGKETTVKKGSKPLKPSKLKYIRKVQWMTR